MAFRLRGGRKRPRPTLNYSRAFAAATCSHAVRLMPCFRAASSTRASKSVSHRMLTVVMPAPSAAVAARAGCTTPAMKASAFASRLTGFTLCGMPPERDMDAGAGDSGPLGDPFVGGVATARADVQEAEQQGPGRLQKALAALAAGQGGA